MNAKKHDFSHVDEEEWQRLYELNQYEDDARAKGYKAIAGIDEAGRGPLAGPVVAAVCLIPQGIYFPHVNDSKLLLPGCRETLYKQITEDRRLCYSVGTVDSAEIDRINIYQATIQAMLIAISKLPGETDFLLVDGLNLPHPTIPCLRIVGGDRFSQSIAAASIIAKVTRDKMMVEYHKKWPQYGFNTNKGYGTAQHIEALKKHGPCEIHRRSFEPVELSKRTEMLPAS